jgi:hypothetical protein
MFRVVVFTPVILAVFDKFEPPLRHWYVRFVPADVATVNETGAPAQTVWLAGWVEITGAVLTVNVAALDVTGELQPLTITS